MPINRKRQRRHRRNRRSLQARAARMRVARHVADRLDAATPPPAYSCVVVPGPAYMTIGAHNAISNYINNVNNVNSVSSVKPGVSVTWPVSTNPGSEGV